MARSLEGNGQPDVLFELQQAVDEYHFRQRPLRECDQQLQGYLGAWPSHRRAEEKGVQPPAGASGALTPLQKDLKRRKRPRKNEPDFNGETELERICGVHLKTLDGVDAMTIFTFVSELGVDMSPWRSQDHRVSWLKLAPQRQVSGGKLIQHERSPVKNRVAEALRMAASTLDRSHSYLGARFRSLRSRRGPEKPSKPWPLIWRD